MCENGQIVAYTVNPTTGALRTIQATAIPFGGFCVVSRSNKFVYEVTGISGSQSILGYQIGKTGALTQITGSPFPSTGANGLAFTPTGKFAYAPDFVGSNNIEEFSVNATTGALTPIGTIPSGQEPSDLTITPKGTFAYATNFLDNTISAFSINPTTGALTAVSGSPFPSGNKLPAAVTVAPNGKYLFVVNFATNQAGSLSVFAINSATGALTLKSDNAFPSGWGYSGGNTTIDPSGKFIYIGSNIGTAGVEGYTVNESNGTVAPIGQYASGSDPVEVTVDASSSFLYVGNGGGNVANEPSMFVFSINHTTGALSPLRTQGLDGQPANNLAFSTSTVAVKYTPTFAYVTNSGSNSITELGIANGTLTNIGTVTDTNGPQASVATASGAFFYTGNSNGSISEYSIGKTGALKKLTGSPITGLTNPVGMAISPFYNTLYAEDPTAGSTFDYNINTKTGVLSLFFSGGTDGNGPDAIAVDPFGAFTLVVNNASNQVVIGIPGIGWVNTVGTGSSPVAITIDPSSQFVYVANSGDGTVSAYNLTLASPYLTPIAGSPFTAGTTPSAVVAEPFGRYLYVANSGGNTISAYGIDPLSGALTPISGTFPTSGSPSALSVSNNGKYLYVTNKDIGELDQFTINSDGTLAGAGGAGVGTAPTSVTAIGTYK